LWTNAVLMLVLAVCVYTDARSRIIPNKVTFPALGAALVLHLAVNGWPGLLHSAAGLGVGLSILLVPYLMGGMGAGDVKLLAVVGALKGTGFVLATSVYMALVGALMALVIVLVKPGARERLRYVVYLLICLRYRIKPAFGPLWTSGAYPYGVAIAGGAVLCLWLKGWGV